MRRKVAITKARLAAVVNSMRDVRASVRTRFKNTILIHFDTASDFLRSSDWDILRLRNVGQETFALAKLVKRECARRGYVGIGLGYTVDELQKAVELMRSRHRKRFELRDLVQTLYDVRYSAMP